MESPFARIFLDLSAYIHSEVPEIQFIEQDLGQLGDDNMRAALAYPCVLIDFPDTNFSNLQGKNQLALPTIAITLVMDTYGQTNHLAPIEWREVGLQYLELEQQVFMAVQGWESDYCESLVRIKSTGHNRNDVGLRVREMTFTAQYEDYSCNDNSQRVKLGLRTE